MDIDYLRITERGEGLMRLLSNDIIMQPDKMVAARWLYAFREDVEVPPWIFDALLRDGYLMEDIVNEEADVILFNMSVGKRWG